MESTLITHHPGSAAPLFMASQRIKNLIEFPNHESAPALLAGLSILLNTLQLLSEYSVEELNQFKIAAFAQNRDV